MASQGFHPPQQARSHATLRKVLAAAEHVLAHDGIDGFTIGAVAEQAGMSVGAIYRRFEGKDQLLYAVKDQLLGQLETSVAEALGGSSPELSALVGAFTDALARTFARHGRTFPDLLDRQSSTGRDRGLAALATVQQAFVDAVSAAEIRRPDAAQACRMIARTVIGSCVHRAASSRYWPDELSWPAWAAETTEIALAYLTSAGRDQTLGADSSRRAMRSS